MNSKAPQSEGSADDTRGEPQRGLARSSGDGVSGAGEPKLRYAAVVQVLGPTFKEVVGAPVAERFAVALEGERGEVPAGRAASCLLEPEAGDRVLLVDDGDARAILAVITRGAATRGGRISADGDLTIDLPSGRFEVSSQKEVRLQSAAKVSIGGPEVALTGLRASITASEIELSARATQLRSESLSLAAETLDVVASRLRERFKNVHRTVTELEQLRANCVDFLVRHTLRIHAKHTVVSADEAAKIDAKNVFLG